MAQGITALPIHHHTGLRAIGIVNGRPVWPILGGDDSDDAAAKAAAAAADDDGHADVSLEELQAALDELGLKPGQLKGRLAASRRWEDRAKEKDPEIQAMREKAAQYDVLLEASQSDQERAVETAKQEAKAAALLEATPRIVRAEFRAAAKGVLTDAQLSALLEDRDLTKYVTDSGDVDEAKIAKIVADTAPAGGQQHVDLGQGRRKTEVKPSVANGRELFETTRGKKQPA